MLPSDVNWLAMYNKILALPPRELKEQQAQILGNFPSSYHYSKRMAEQLLLLKNSKSDLKLSFIRPSIVATAANEPLPGWTDSTGLLQGAGLLVGLGIFRDVMGNPSHIADIVPVDFVARQILVSVPFMCQYQLPLFVSHASTSSLNPTTWQQFFDSCTTYQNDFPYEKRAGPAALTMHRSVK